jgi:hypothetical protein
MAREHISDAQLGEYYDMAYDLNSDRSQRINKIFGSNTIFSMFTKGPESPLYERYMKPRVEQHGWDPEEYKYEVGLKSPIPWDSAPRYKDRPAFDQSKVSEELSRPTMNVREFDPRFFHGSQPSVTSPGVRHYLEKGAGGPTYADPDNVGNNMPFVYVHRGTGTMRLLGGHHRASSALIKGKPLVARYTVGD